MRPFAGVRKFQLRRGRRARPGPADQVGELRLTLLRSHRLVARLLGSSRQLEEADFAGVAEAWLDVSRDFKQLEAVVPQLRPLARLEELVERFTRPRTNDRAAEQA